MKVLVIVPAYNEEGNLSRTINQLKLLNCFYEIIVINDKSTDNTLSVANELGVKVIDLPCNLGIGGAVQTGYKYAKKNNFDIAIQVDGDGQHGPEYIEQLIRPIIEKSADLVIGSRYINKEGFQSTLIRRIGISYFSKLIYALTGQMITDPTSGFRACNKRVIEIFSQRYPIDYPEPESIMFLKRKYYEIEEVPVVMNSRESGSSSITPIKSIYYMLKVSIAIIIDKLRRETA
ncbi:MULTISPECIES: glycosyltransferase family 2 protein [unclassified Paenibacillus]|uniref:glycosyltransferase family 2 protein n=1 Tax=unclassified Paenibacillus TaxID=185978 RepID=UPI000426711C|nr:MULTISPECIES: glycosyltransferase family 2 protein [unclassified Paenibacillus]KGP77370.1 glycosyl transferase family 2 [Paenibacillus sp. MAEPY2]KGP78072.1 glycosyl transferase family 2 [Paenibacillus sp. MAEPY1]